jgi:hypothetical protein
MAHFAKIDDNNIVLRVDHVDDSIATSEAAGQAHLAQHSGWPAEKWIMTDENTKRNQHLYDGTPFRGNFAATGFEWDSANNVFWPPKGNNPASWVKNNTTADWESPLGVQPQVDQSEKFTHFYTWNEDTQAWDKKAFPTPISQEDYEEFGEEVFGMSR